MDRGPAAGIGETLCFFCQLLRGDRKLNQGENAMGSKENRAALDRHWAASVSGDLEAEHDIYDDSVLCEYPQSGERIRGRRNLQALRGHHPGKPSGFRIRRIVGADNFWVTEYAIDYQGKPFDTVSIMEFRNGKVVHETQYFAEPFPAPAWRAEWVEHAA
jgi:hypothetical protein